MATLFVISTQPLSGKTALCASIGGRLLSEGLKVGYVKALATQVRQIEDRALDEDAVFMKEILDLAHTWEVLSPVNLTDQEMQKVIEGSGNPHPERLKAALSVAEKGRDVLLVEGAGSTQLGSLLGLSVKSCLRMSGGSVLLVARYDGPSTADQVLGVVEALSCIPLGVVINATPDAAQDFARNTLAPFLVSRGLPVLGVLPEERALMGPTVGELAEFLDGEFVRGAEEADNLVEGFLLGALSTDYMQDYYNRRPNVAVITTCEKTDIQLFSMTSSTRCLILTGCRRPADLVMAQASEHGIPIIMVKEDTLTVAEKVEGMFAAVRFHQRRKLPIMAKMIEAGLDLSAIYRELGLKVKV
ncbi:MAG: AAA family ATPase [Dehalococcoidia bacterium]|nr:AAA family ATPase [Dehalococcoidia bacterium]